MKLKKYIEGLQKVLNEHGDIECYYARDDEGNGYQQVQFNGTVFYVRHLQHYIDEIYSDEDIEEENVEKPIRICVVN